MSELLDIRFRLSETMAKLHHTEKVLQETQRRLAEMTAERDKLVEQLLDHEVEANGYVNVIDVDGGKL